MAIRATPARWRALVRAGLELEIESNARNDTTPVSVWQYIEGRERDTAIARWIVDTTRPPPRLHGLRLTASTPRCFASSSDCRCCFNRGSAIVLLRHRGTHSPHVDSS